MYGLEDFERAFSDMVRERAIGSTILLHVSAHARQIADLRLPSMSEYTEEFVTEGGLMAYGVGPCRDIGQETGGQEAQDKELTMLDDTRDHRHCPPDQCRHRRPGTAHRDGLPWRCRQRSHTTQRDEALKRAKPGRRAQ